MRYVIVTIIPFAMTEDGLFAVEEKWGWDLQAHLGVFENLHVLAPLADYDPDNFRYTFLRDSIAFHPLPSINNYFELIRLPAIIRSINMYIKREDLIHSVGAPLPPLGIIANLLGWLKGCKRRLIVLDADTVKDLELRARSARRFYCKFFYYTLMLIFYNLFKLCISTSPLSFVVGDSLFERYKKFGNVHKIHASWVREEEISHADDLGEKIEQMMARRELRLCFAARLVPSKGPQIAVDAMKYLKQRGIPVILDIYGTGPMAKSLNDLINNNELNNIISLKGEVLFSRFYEVLRQYDAILVPNLSGEQPRIIFDALANGVIVVGSDIRSINAIIIDGVNGILCLPDDPQSFASGIEDLYHNKNSVEQLISSGIETVRENTIESIHSERKRLIDTYISSS